MKTHQGLISPQLHRCVSADQTDIRYKHDPEQILSLSASLTLWTQWTCSMTSPISSFMVCVCSCSSFICSNMVSLPPLNRQTQKNKGSNITASACMLSPFKQSEVTVTAEDKHSRITSLPSMQMHCCAPEARFHTVCLCDRQESHEVTWPEATETLMRAAREFSSTETQHTLAQRARGGKLMEISDARQKANQSWWHHEYVHYIIEARSGYFP